MLFGHEDKVKIFRKLVKEGSLNHAYIFYGDEQIGKFSFSRSLANFLENGEFKPEEKILIETKIVSPQEETIGIDYVREIKQFLSKSPIASIKRLAIINDAHLLTSEAQAALLKMVEEPFANSLLIFIVPELQGILPPLLSRLTKVYFLRLPKKEVEQILVKEYEIPKESAKKISEISFGRIGYALSLLQNKQDENEDNLKKDLENKIVELYTKNPQKNGAVLGTLLKHESVLKRFNLNNNLQRKAIEYELNK